MSDRFVIKAGLTLLQPDWPAPASVSAWVTTRLGGVSAAPYDSLNLGQHVDDDPAAVAENRQRLQVALALPQSPRWLEQVHSAYVLNADSLDGVCRGDAALSQTPGTVCVVMTADCLPVLFCNRNGTEVAAAHAGWRGLADGILENSIKQMRSAPADILAWLGPAIGPEAFEVGDEVREAFIKQQPETESAFKANDRGRWLADLYALARCRLKSVGVEAIYGGEHCTFTDREHFYSYRRDQCTGRMASLIWIDA